MLVYRAEQMSQNSRSRTLLFVRATKHPPQDTHLLPHRGDFGNSWGQLWQAMPQAAPGKQAEIGASYYIPCLGPIRAEDFFHILTDYFNFEVRSLAKLVHNKMRIVSTKDVKIYRNFEAYRPSRLHWRSAAPINQPVMWSWSRTLGPFVLPSTNLWWQM